MPAGAEQGGQSDLLQLTVADCQVGHTKQRQATSDPHCWHFDLKVRLPGRRLLSYWVNKTVQQCEAATATTATLTHLVCQTALAAYTRGVCEIFVYAD